MVNHPSHRMFSGWVGRQLLIIKLQYGVLLNPRRVVQAFVAAPETQMRGPKRRETARGFCNKPTAPFAIKTLTMNPLAYLFIK